MLRLLAAALAAGAALAACGAESGPPARAAAAPIVTGEGGLPAYFDCVRDSGALVVSAHRGGPAPGYPENALQTFANTVARMPAILEIDIQATADGALVLMHDDTLDRTTTGSGRVSEMLLSELERVRLVDSDGQKTDFRIPTLSQALDWADGRSLLVLDRKSTVPFAQVAAVVQEAGAMDRVIWATYSHVEALSLFDVAPGAMITVPIDNTADLDALIDAGAPAGQMIAWSGTDTPDPALYAALAELGVESAFGSLGSRPDSWDNRIAADGDDGLYRSIARGAQILATDRPLAVAGAVPRVAGAAKCPVKTDGEG